MAAAALVALLASAPAGAAQETPSAARDSSGTPAAPSQPAPLQQPVALPPIQLSGIVVGTFRYGGLPDRRSANEFDITRAYLNLRATPSPRTQLRLTTDVLRRSDTLSYRGWSIRLKYAYGQYTVLGAPAAAPDGLRADVRFGMLHTVIIEEQERFWPRWIGQVPVDRLGLMASSDVGAATSVTLPGRRGELYATATNGDGYQTGEADRFKDVAVRLTLTPFAARQGMLRGLAVTPWILRGARASDFAAGRGTVAPVAAARARHRHGVFAGVRTNRFAAGAEWVERLDAVERADTLVDAAPTVASRVQRLTAAFGHARPLAGTGLPLAPLGVIARIDRLENLRGGTGESRYVLGGLTWDLDPRVLVGIDYQEQTARGGFSAADLRFYSFRMAVSY